jgi:hypothetical protein
MKKPVIIVASALLVASLGYLFQHRSSLAPPESKQAIKRSIKIAQFGDVFLYAPIYIAKDAGFLYAFRGRDAPAQDCTPDGPSLSDQVAVLCLA